MITRLWNAWTTRANADAYETLLKTCIFPGIRSKGISGLSHIELLRRDAGDEVEFIVIMRFADTDSIRALTGGSYEQAYVPEEARQILKRYDPKARHFATRFTDMPALEMHHAV